MARAEIRWTQWRGVGISDDKEITLILGKPPLSVHGEQLRATIAHVEACLQEAAAAWQALSEDVPLNTTAEEVTDTQLVDPRTMAHRLTGGALELPPGGSD